MSAIDQIETYGPPVTKSKMSVIDNIAAAQTDAGATSAKNTAGNRRLISTS